MTDEMTGDLLGLFATLDEHSTPLTEELFKEMERRDKMLNDMKADDAGHSKTFWGSPSFTKWPGLVHTALLRSSAGRPSFGYLSWACKKGDNKSGGDFITGTESYP